jgi:hypothetical protein
MVRVVKSSEFNTSNSEIVTNQNSQISIRYNSADKSILISSQNELKQTEIYDLAGFRKKIILGKGYSQELFTNDFKPGIYIFKVVDNKGNSKNEKIIVQ